MAKKNTWVSRMAGKVKRHFRAKQRTAKETASKKRYAEHYKKAGIKVTNWHTSSGWIASIKNEATRSIKLGGKAICFGWNSNGLGKKRGFKMIRILLVAHGGSHNDTIVTVEEKIQVQGILDI